MAIDNLNYYSAWLPAGQQTDRYSSQPWCLRSKNLDIFSSSKSVKATAWTTPTQTDSDVIKEEWGLVLKTDWKVYERTALGDTLLVDPSVNFPVYKVSYTWENWPFSDAEWGTVQDMSVAYEWDEWKSFVVYTDRSSFTYSKVKFTPRKSFGWDTNRLIYDSESPYVDGYLFRKSWNNQYNSLWLIVDNPWFATIPVKVKAYETNDIDSHISLQSYILYEPKWYYYDPEVDSILPTAELKSITEVPVSWDIIQWIELELPALNTYNWRRMIALNFKWTKVSWSSTTNWTNWELYIDINWWPVEWHMMSWHGDWDYNYYYSYLPIRERKLQEIWVYGYSMAYWLKWDTFQALYKWVSSWVEYSWQKFIRYDFVTDMWWANDPWMDVVWLIIWNEQVYMVGNLNGDWYIIPCDLTWWVGNPYVAYWCTFKGATNIDYLMYLVWDDRGISQLWVFNNQELVSLVWGNQEKDKKNLIKNEEQYKFDWKIIEYRGNLILSTEDNRLFEYGQTYGGKWGTFIHEIDGEIKELKAKGNDLIVKYTKNNIDYTIIYQDDTPIKNYNTEWMAEYPIVIWNHLLEKEESDLFASFILPSSATKLEFWGMANHYHFWTFTTADNPTLSGAENYKIKWASWTYALKFIEKNDNQYTFRLEWDLPVQTTNEMKITDSNNTVVINYTDFNHFRKIWTIETDKYCEWEFRFHNLNNKLELPKSHSLQIMVKGKGNQNYTPELFALDLVANQRERW